MTEEIDKAHYTRVSEVLQPYNGLDGIPEDILGNAARRGTIIHELCEIYAKEGCLIPTEHEGYLGAFKNWFDQHVMQCMRTEERLYDDLREVTGKYDLLVELFNGDICLVDIKTTASKSDTWPLQLGAYQRLFEQTYDWTPKRMVLHLNKKGTYNVYNYNDDERDQDLFFSALKLHRYFKRG